jgi:phenylacetate-CoA ligase
MTLAHHIFLDTIRRTQFAPRPQMRAYEDGLLEAMVRFARENVPFYRDRLAAAFPGGRFDRERFAEVPLLSRAEAVAAGEALHAPEDDSYIRAFKQTATSGSTGNQFAFRQGLAVQVASDCNNERAMEMNGLDRTNSFAWIRVDRDRKSPYPLGYSRRGWNLTNPEAPYFALDATTDTREQVEWLRRRRPAYLCSYPANLSVLCEAVGEDGGISFGKVLTIGETVSPELRDTVRRTFGCEIMDGYASNEFGQMAVECPHGGYHVSAESMLVELLNEDGTPAAPGTPGIVAVTSYYNYAQPFIRYLLGDHAVWASGPCPCGRTLPRLERVLGRSRAIFRFKDGTQKWPWVPREQMLELAAAARIQVVQTQLDRLEVRRVPALRGAPDPGALQAFFRTYLHHSLSVELVDVAVIPQSPSGKIEGYISQLPTVVPPARRA